MTVSALTRGRHVPELDEVSRLLECTVCGGFVRVHELPSRFLDETDFVGGCCLRLVAAADEELPNTERQR